MKRLFVLMTILALTFIFIDGCLPVQKYPVFRVYEHNWVMNTTTFSGTCFGVCLNGRRIRSFPRVLNYDRYFLTAAHVVTDAYCDSFYIESDGNRYFVSIEARDDSLDLALLSISESVYFPCPQFGDPSNLRFGATIYAAGYAGFLKEGVKTKCMVLKVDDPEILFTGLIIGGMSGGPVLDEHGKIIGLLIGYYKPKMSEHCNVAVSSQAIQKFLGEYNGRLARTP